MCHVAQGAGVRGRAGGPQAALALLLAEGRPVTCDAVKALVAAEARLAPPALLPGPLLTLEQAGAPGGRRPCRWRPRRPQAPA
ncbi:MAG TPA: hypothetical protein VFS43_27460 [Polyangiaceae bacterium]|nr:hypothetical protein [Polyangiaceae bacterium]